MPFAARLRLPGDEARAGPPGRPANRARANAFALPLEIDEPVTMLAWVARVTRTIRFGTSVLVLPYRHPVALAKTLATLGRLAGGGRRHVAPALAKTPDPPVTSRSTRSA